MPSPAPDSPPGRWSAGEIDLTIEYDPAVLEEIRIAVVDAFFSIPRGGTEVGGVLFGERRGRVVRVLDFRPLACEHANGPGFVLSPADRGRLADLLSHRADPALDGLVPVGWYHSHTRSEIFLSEKDLEIHRIYFPEDWQVALVLRPHTYQPTRGGFFARGSDGRIRADASYREFALTPRPTRQDRAEKLPAAVGDGVVATGPLPESEAALDAGVRTDPAGEWPIPPPAFLSSSPDSRAVPWRLLVLIALLAAGVGAYATRDRWLPSASGVGWNAGREAPPTPLKLGLADRHGQLEILWDSLHPAVKSAASGALEITDGDATLVVPLDPASLQSGAYTYQRHSGTVRVRLRLRPAKGGRGITVASGFTGEAVSAEPAPEVVLLRNDKEALQRAVSDLKRQNAELQKTISDLHVRLTVQQNLLRMDSAPRPAPKP